MQTKRIAAVVAILVAASAAWYLGSPLFLNTVVDEPVPSAGNPAMMDRLDAMTSDELAALPQDQRMQAERMMHDMADMPGDTVTEPMPAGPEIEYSGMFRDADAFHKGSGTASVLRLSDGGRMLRFERFSVTNGPNLHVYLVKAANGDVESGFLDLGKLKGNRGSQNYELPPGIDVSEYKSVIVWCVPFSVTFTVAELR